MPEAWLSFAEISCQKDPERRYSNRYSTKFLAFLCHEEVKKEVNSTRHRLATAGRTSIHRAVQGGSRLANMKNHGG